MTVRIDGAKKSCFGRRLSSSSDCLGKYLRLTESLHYYHLVYFLEKINDLLTTFLESNWNKTCVSSTTKYCTSVFVHGNQNVSFA